MSGAATSIIIPSLDGLHHLEVCLPTVLASAGGDGDREVIVVDNGSRDGTVASLRRRFPSVRVVALEDNRGFAGGVAAGAAAAGGEILVFLNNDTRVHPGWLGALVEALEGAPPEVATVSGKTLSWDGERVDFVRGALTFDGHAFQLDFGRPVADVAAADVPAPLPFPCGCNMAVRRRAWEEVGGFDPVYFAYGEDVDFGWRAWLTGWEHRFEPAALTFHRSGATGTALGGDRRGYLFERNAFMTLFKNLEEPLFQRLLAPVLWTLLHRTWSLLEAGNTGGEALASYPFPPADEEAPATGRRRWRSLLLRWAVRLASGGRADQGILVHDRRTLSQLRAVRFLLHRLEALQRERDAVQRRRRRGDAAYFERFPMLLVPTYPGDQALFASPVFRRWLPREPDIADRSLEAIGELGAPAAPERG